MITRAHTKTLFPGNKLTKAQKTNSGLNLKEIEKELTVLHSFPRRIILELTNSCNMNCIMCGRNYASFTHNYLDMDVLNWLKPLLNMVEEVTLMGWGEPTVHPHFISFLKFLDQYPVRKYICTNGLTLSKYVHTVFDYHVDILAVSVNGATPDTNDGIRRGGNLKQVILTLKQINDLKRNPYFPYLCLVYCLMRSNMYELEKLIDLAVEIGVNKVKIVHLTAFSKELANETLWGHEAEIASIFDTIKRKAVSHGIVLELPYLCGEDPAGTHIHKECFTAWRDFYIGSDGFVRPCMSTSEKFFKLNFTEKFMDVWNSDPFIAHRDSVNKEEKMSDSCRNCYQATFCNWNKEKSYMQIETEFSPQWDSPLY